MNNHPGPSDDVLRLVFGELNEVRRAEVRKAIVENAELSAVAEGLELAVAALRKESSAELSDDFNDRLRRRWQADLLDAASVESQYDASTIVHTSGVIRRERRWVWPAAFSAMTCVAAMLFVMLMIRDDSPVTDRTMVNLVHEIAPPMTLSEMNEVLEHSGTGLGAGSSDKTNRNHSLRNSFDAGVPMAASRWDGRDRMLVSGDKGLPNDFWTRDPLAMNSDEKSGHPGVRPADSLNHFELMQRMLKNSEADGEGTRSRGPNDSI